MSKIEKKHWLKRPKVGPRNEIWMKIKIQNIIFGILFLKILFRTYNVFIFVTTFQRTSPELLFYFPDFLGENLKSNKNQRKDYSFCNTVLLKKPHSFLNLNSLDIEKDMLPQHSQSSFWLYEFSSKHFFVWCQKKHLHCTIS